MNQIEKHTALDKHLSLVAELYLREIIREENPQWVNNDGECKECDKYYESLLNVVEIK